MHHFSLIKIQEVASIMSGILTSPAWQMEWTRPPIKPFRFPNQALKEHRIVKYLYLRQMCHQTFDSASRKIRSGIKHQKLKARLQVSYWWRRPMVQFWSSIDSRADHTISDSVYYNRSNTSSVHCKSSLLKVVRWQRRQGSRFKRQMKVSRNSIR